MTLHQSLQFNTARETTDGRGWHLAWWDDTVPPAPAAPTVTDEYLYRLDRPVGGVAAASKTVSNKALTSNVATLTTSASHGFVAGDWVIVALAPADAVFDGAHLIATVPTGTTFTFAKTNANVTSAAAAGTAASQPSAFERIKAVASADPETRTYFTASAQAAVLAANSSTVNSTRDASLTAEGLTP